MTTAGQQTGNFKLIAGHISLDFTNTADWHASQAPDERLTGYGDLLAWSQQVGILTEHEVQRLRDVAARYPAAAAAVLEQAIALRETLYRIFVAVAGRRTPAANDIALLNAALAKAMARLQLVATEGDWRWAWADGEDALDRMLWPVVWSAAELLTSEARWRVRVCADERCGWLFLDMGRNRGNRAKARRHYQRTRGTAAPAP